VETKVDLLADLIYKLIINDIHTLQCEVKELQKFQWKCIGAFAVAWAILNYIVPPIIKLIMK
jgi:hypothetical protein